jgi:hypothetical protein
VLTDQAPGISEPRLAERLKDLAPEDAAELERVREIVSWTRLSPREEAASFVARANALLDAIRGDPVRAAVRDRLEIRTLLAALRRRHAGGDAPVRGEAWGVGRYVETIRSHWSAADFGVKHLFPWIVSAKQKLEAGDRIGLERIVLESAWAAGERHLALHSFDYEAVVYYVLRWSLIDRWSRYDAEAATTRFAELLDEALAEFAALRSAA